MADRVRTKARREPPLSPADLKAELATAEKLLAEADRILRGHDARAKDTR